MTMNTRQTAQSGSLHPICSALVARLKRRLATHRRRLRYWSGLPSLTGYGPTGRKLSSGYMGEKYELAACDARSIAEQLSAAGVEVKVIDILETFRARYYDPKAAERLIWPNAKTKP